MKEPPKIPNEAALDLHTKNWHIATVVKITSNSTRDRIQSRMMCVNKNTIIRSMIFVSFLLIPQIAASSPWRYSLYFENDTFFNTDYLYTNGVKISASSPSEATWEELGYLPEFVLPFVKSLPHSNRGKDSYSLTFSMGQLIYTPEDTDRTEPVPGDRPYAGIGFLECGFNALGPTGSLQWA